MKLRDFRNEDADVICSWLRTEDELYRWSADRFNKYPLTGQDIVDNYAPQIESGKFFPLTVTDEDGKILGHFIIRYPREDNPSSVRFGFVILDPAERGRGYGKEMLRLGLKYAGEKLNAERVDLGVFEGNDSARGCYEAVGFKEYSRRMCEMPIGTWECVDMELFL